MNHFEVYGNICKHFLYTFNGCDILPTALFHGIAWMLNSKLHDKPSLQNTEVFERKIRVYADSYKAPFSPFF